MRRIKFATILAVMFLSGCGEDIETRFGSRMGASVNGTGVLADMLENAGHQVISRSSLSPGLHETADVIVWFPDDFQPPGRPAIGWLENWLGARAGRTVIYVGRDYDAAPAYWREIQPLPPLEQAPQVQAKRLAAEQQFDSMRMAVVDGASCSWFTQQKIAKPPLRATTFTGPWSVGINPTGADIESVFAIQIRGRRRRAIGRRWGDNRRAAKLFRTDRLRKRRRD